MNKYRKEYCEENGSVKINPDNTKLYDYIKHLENKLEQAEQLTLTDVGKCDCDKINKNVPKDGYTYMCKCGKEI